MSYNKRNAVQYVSILIQNNSILQSTKLINSKQYIWFRVVVNLHVRLFQKIVYIVSKMGSFFCLFHVFKICSAESEIPVLAWYLHSTESAVDREDAAEFIPTTLDDSCTQGPQNPVTTLPSSAEADAIDHHRSHTATSASSFFKTEAIFPGFIRTDVFLTS